MYCLCEVSVGPFFDVGLSVCPECLSITERCRSSIVSRWFMAPFCCREEPATLTRFGGSGERGRGIQRPLDISHLCREDVTVGLFEMYVEMNHLKT